MYGVGTSPRPMMGRPMSHGGTLLGRDRCMCPGTGLMRLIGMRRALGPRNLSLVTYKFLKDIHVRLHP